MKNRKYKNIFIKFSKPINPSSQYGMQQNTRKKSKIFDQNLFHPFISFFAKKFHRSFANSHIVLQHIKSIISCVNRSIFPNNLVGATSGQLRFLRFGGWKHGNTRTVQIKQSLRSTGGDDKRRGPHHGHIHLAARLISILLVS